jgi:hypothetical protein
MNDSARFELSDKCRRRRRKQTDERVDLPVNSERVH